MQGQQVLNLEQSSFILWNPKKTESMRVHRAVNLGFVRKRCKTRLNSERQGLSLADVYT